MIPKPALDLAQLAIADVKNGGNAYRGMLESLDRDYGRPMTERAIAEAHALNRAAETARIAETIKEIPTPCSNCKKIAYVCAPDRWKGRWTCYGCGTINRWER